MTSTAAATQAVAAVDALTLNHFYCCDGNRGLCGADLSGHDEAIIVDCVVCIDLYETNAPCNSGCPLAVSA
jgi:hypothetical protein